LLLQPGEFSNLHQGNSLAQLRKGFAEVGQALFPADSFSIQGHL
jgi:hypothetical protein